MKLEEEGSYFVSALSRYLDDGDAKEPLGYWVDITNIPLHDIPECWAPNAEAAKTCFMIRSLIWPGRGLNPRPTDQEAEPSTITLSCCRVAKYGNNLPENCSQVYVSDQFMWNDSISSPPNKDLEQINQDTRKLQLEPRHDSSPGLDRLLHTKSDFSTFLIT